MRYHFEKPAVSLSMYGRRYICNHPVYDSCTLFEIDEKEFFDSRARTCTDGLYPTVTIRQIMWALKMKPLPKQKWETVFDRRDI